MKECSRKEVPVIKGRNRDPRTQTVNKADLMFGQALVVNPEIVQYDLRINPQTQGIVAGVETSRQGKFIAFHPVYEQTKEVPS